MTTTYDAAVSSSVTNAGNVRKINEDSLLVDDKSGIWIVADGMGGYEKGEAASQLAASEVLNSIRKGVATKVAIEQAHQSIIQELSGKEGSKSGTTIVVLEIKDNNYTITWAGDSRAYVLKNKEIKQLSHDHTYVQYLLDSKKITQKQADESPDKHMLTSGLGVAFEKIPLLDSTSGIIAGDEIFILCSDGLYNELSDSQIQTIVSDDKSLSDKAAELLNDALNKDAKDNISAVLVEVSGVSKPPGINKDVLMLGVGIVGAVILFYIFKFL